MSISKSIQTEQLEEKLKNYLNLLWLRPENALLMTFKSSAFDDFQFESPSVDISCGDGLFMFTHLHGQIDSGFDRFLSVKASEFKHSSFVDIYDAYQDDYDVKIIQPPGSIIDYGTDWKQTLLNKASKLGLYKALKLHDNNEVPLPFPDDYFSTIYSNSVYWVKRVEHLLLDIHRMLKPHGKALLEVMTLYHLDTLEKLTPLLSKSAIDILDRKRRATMPGTRVFTDWKELIQKCSFKIVECRNVFPGELIIDVWNIGLRPISHLLMQMANTQSYEQRCKIKQEWVDVFYELFKPLLHVDQPCAIEKAPYISFLLEK